MPPTSGSNIRTIMDSTYQICQKFNFMKKTNRRQFIQQLGIAGAATAALSLHTVPTFAMQPFKKIGIIGLDTSHSEMFTKDINQGSLKDRGYRVIAAYPHGSEDIPSALEMKPRIIEAVKNMGVEIVNSIEQLLEKVDYVLLESNDGRVHFHQASQGIKAKKPMFIDKPMAEDLQNGEAIFALAAKFDVRRCTCASSGEDKFVQEVRNGKIGKVLAADVSTRSEIERNHPDQAWYMIHGIQMLSTVMGTGCTGVYRESAPGIESVFAV